FAPPSRRHRHDMLPTIAACLYLAASGLLWRHANCASTPAGTGAAKTIADKFATPAVIRLVIAAAVALHALHLYAQLYPSGRGAANLALGHVASLVAWMSVALLLLASTLKQTLNLGLVVLPLGLLGLVIGAALPGAAFYLSDGPAGAGRHIAIAVPAYGVLSIAFAQALLLWLQEKQLRKVERGRFFPALPALETMESNLAHLIVIGFVLLTINLVTGMHSARQAHGAWLVFNHHILLSLLAWAGFGALLVGRAWFGWRGRLAAQWTVAAFALLALAYFGTRFVNDVIL
ncbi:MAG: cytochrome c biogenesis protein CcsA, partial [Gammaproteobacteria bacterium]|nr:cytochrome c biogenesis protein CcsA [Gammaproteobacteria bacterium]